MKSVLHVALIAPNGYSNEGMMKGFFGAGFTEYHLFDFQLKTFDTDRDTMRRMLIQEAERIKPDMVFMQIQGSDILDIATFKRLSEISFTVNYTFDIRTKEQTEWLYNLAPILGLICFSNQRDVDECNRREYSNAMVLQSSADPDIYKPSEGVQRKGVVFIGNNFMNTNHQFPLSKDRAEMVEFLQKEFPDDFAVYGNNWGNSKLVDQKKEIDIYQSAAIVINQNNFDAELYTSDRLWRAVFCGSLCFTKHFKGVERLFDMYNQVECWNTFGELKRLIYHYLTHPKSATRNASSAREHALANHTWASRIKEMLNFIGPVQKKVNANACLSFGAHVIDGTIPTPADQHFDGRTCDCNKLIWRWEQCECGNKEFQLRAHENI